MSIKFFSGFEWGSVVAAVELRNSFGTPTLSTTTYNTGARAMRVNNTTIYTAKGVADVFQAADSNVLYAQFYLYIHTSVDAETTIFALYDAAGGAMSCSLHLTTDDKLGLWYNDTASQVGANSSALSKDAWHRIEVKFDRSGGAGAGILQARIDGAANFASSTTLTITNGANQIGLGCELNGDGATTMDVFFDDVVVSDSAYPAGARVVIAVPNAAGDSDPTAGDYTSVNEIPPSATVTDTTTRCDLDSNGVTAYFNLDTAANLGIDSYDTILAVRLLARVREEAAGTSSYQLGIKSASGGTEVTTTAADAGNATIRTNPAATTAFGRDFIVETDPTTSSAWTPTGTNSIDNMQIGILNVDADSTPDLWLVAMAAMILYRDGTPSASYGEVSTTTKMLLTGVGL